MAKHRHAPRVRPLESPLTACLLSTLDPVPVVAAVPANVFSLRMWHPENDWTSQRARAIASRQRRKRRQTGAVTERLAAVLQGRLRLHFLRNPARYRAVFQANRNARVLADFEIVDP